MRLRSATARHTRPHHRATHQREHSQRLNKAAEHVPCHNPEAPLEIPLQRKQACACGGSCPRCQEQGEPVQAKLKISMPGDKYEQEADRVADQVVNSGYVSQPVTSLNSQVQRQPEESVSSMDEQEEEEGTAEIIAQAKRCDHQHDENMSVSENTMNTIKYRGERIPDNVRADFEERMGYDFRHVRLHTDSRAGLLAKNLNSHAFTYANHIVFARGQYQPASRSGRHLLAHELTHVVQQTMPSGRRSVYKGRTVSRAKHSIQRLLNSTTCTNHGLEFMQCYKVDGYYNDAINYTRKTIGMVSAKRYTSQVSRALKLAFNISGHEHKQAIVNNLRRMLATMIHYKANMLYARGDPAECRRVERGKEKPAYSGPASINRQGQVVQSRPSVWLCPAFFSSGKGSKERVSIIVHEHAHVAGLRARANEGEREIYMSTRGRGLLQPSRLLRSADSYAYLVMSTGGGSPVLASTGVETGVIGGLTRPKLPAGAEPGTRRPGRRVAWMIRGYVDVSSRPLLRVLYLYGQAAFTVMVTKKLAKDKPGEKRFSDTAVLLELLGGLRIKVRKSTLGYNWYLSLGGGPLLVISDIRDMEGNVKRVSVGAKGGLSTTMRIKQLEFKASLSYLHLPKVYGFEHALQGGVTVGYRFTWP